MHLRVSSRVTWEQGEWTEIRREQGEWTEIRREQAYLGTFNYFLEGAWENQKGAGLVAMLQF